MPIKLRMRLDAKVLLSLPSASLLPQDATGLDPSPNPAFVPPPQETELPLFCRPHVAVSLALIVVAVLFSAIYVRQDQRKKEIETSGEEATHLNISETMGP